MSPPRPTTLLRTLWYLRREQWVGQLRRRLPGADAPLHHAGPPPGLRLGAPAVAFLGAPAHAWCDGAGRLRLIRREVDFGEAIDWDYAAAGPLWAYHLHQFDWARTAELEPSARLRLMRDWVARHRSGVGWDPGPTSLRSINWLKLLATPGALPEDEAARVELLASLADQLTTLAAHLETHLLANHYLWNLLALVFAEVALEPAGEAAWVGHERRLLAELEEQVDADGAHYERSPMYHALLLENVLDLLNALQALPAAGSERLRSALRETAGRMLGALAVWTHPDGRIALFGDAALEVAASPGRLHAYGEVLGVVPRSPAEPGVLRRAGYARLEAGPFVLIASAAAPSPSYQPGHAHCDALSFELSVEGLRVVTDTGVYEYRAGPRRDAARATRSHATVEVGGADQAELWAAHRVGGRPDVALLGVEPGRAAEGVCASWSTSEVLHRRRFEVTEEGVRLADRFDLPAPSLRAFLPLAPGLQPRLDGAHARIPLPGGRTLAAELPPGLRWKLEQAPCFPEFGCEIPRPVLVGEGEQVAELAWHLHLV